MNKNKRDRNSYFLKGFILTFLVFFLVWLGMSSPVGAGDTGTGVLFLGDSLTAGLGLMPEEAYPARIDELLKKKGNRNVKITNASISGSTTAGALSRLKWFLRANPDIMVLALGANDGLRGLSTHEMFQNLEKTILLAQANGIRVILAGMKLPPNYGPDYSRAFTEVFDRLAQKHHLSFIPFLLEKVAGNPLLNQADGIHPNRAGHEIIAATVLPYIQEQL
jgi:acyl-CoA thioesterase I